MDGADSDLEDGFEMLAINRTTGKQFFGSRRYKNLVSYLLGFLKDDDFIEIMFTNKQIHDLCVKMKGLRKIIEIKNKFVPKLMEKGFNDILLDRSENNILLTLKKDYKIMQTSFQTMIKEFFSRWVNLHWFVKKGLTEIQMQSLEIVYKTLLLTVFKRSKEINKLTFIECKIDTYYFNDLLENIQGLPLKYLDIQKNHSFTSKNIEQFNLTMKCLDKLQHFNLSNCGIKDDIMAEISFSFSYLVSLETLILSNNSFTFKTLEGLLIALKSLPSFTNFDLDSIKLSTAGCHYIEAFLNSEECKLKILNLSNSGMGNNGLKVIIKALKENTTLDTIILKNIDANEEGLALLIKAIPEMNVRFINFGDNIISENLFNKLKKAIVGSRVKSVNLFTKKTKGLEISNFKYEDYSITV
jgi:hypothetical protein